MPKYKKRDPEYTAIQFTGSNIREVMDELGPGFRTHYDLDIENATEFYLASDGWDRYVQAGNWIVVDHEADTWWQARPDDFEREYAPVKRVGRPPKEKK